MTQPPEFASLTEMESSTWLTDIKAVMSRGDWPAECVRCQETDPHSIRRFAEQLDAETEQEDYLQVGGVLDNLCNAACQTCNENLSTRIGSLNSRVFPIIDNLRNFQSLPRDRIVHLDINGGEPSYSKNYRAVLDDLPPNLRTLRVNTNGSRVITQLADIAQRGVKVTVTMSCDGVGDIFEFVRWPVTWEKFCQTLEEYKKMPVEINLWTTVSVLNQQDLDNIKAFAESHGIGHSYAYLKSPWQLSVDNKDAAAREEYIRAQKKLRGIE